MCDAWFDVIQLTAGLCKLQSNQGINRAYGNFARAWVMASWRNVDQAGDAFDEVARGSKRGACGLLGYVRTGTGFIVGNRFELIALGKKGAQFISDAQVVSDKPSKLALNGRMSFIDTAGRLEDESLCGMGTRRGRPFVQLLQSNLHAAWSRLGRGTHALCRGRPRSPVSQVQPFTANFVHERRPFIVRTGRVGQGADNRAAVVKDVGLNLGKPV